MDLSEVPTDLDNQLPDRWTSTVVAAAVAAIASFSGSTLHHIILVLLPQNM